jgi:hypothetical protein
MKGNILLFISMVICLGSFVTNRFIVPVPDPVTIALLIIAAGLLVTHIVIRRRK